MTLKYTDSDLSAASDLPETGDAQMSDGAQDLVPVVARYMVENESLRRSLSAALAKGREEAMAICRGWIDQFGDGPDIQFTPARAYARDAIHDIMDNIRALSPSWRAENDGKWRAPPHERSEGEQTERPGAVDPLDQEMGRVLSREIGQISVTDSALVGYAEPLARRFGQRLFDVISEKATTAITAARNAGRAEMRERAAECAETCLNIENPDERYGDGIEDAERLIARAIRALPLQAEGEDPPHG